MVDAAVVARSHHVADVLGVHDLEGVADDQVGVSHTGERDGHPLVLREGGPLVEEFFGIGLEAH